MSCGGRRVLDVPGGGSRPCIWILLPPSRAPERQSCTRCEIGPCNASLGSSRRESPDATVAGMRWKPTRRLYWVAVVSLASVVAVACGDDDDEASSVEHYCELAREHYEAGLEMFAEVQGDASATEEDFAEAERQFVEDHQDD